MDLTDMSGAEIKDMVRARYGGIAAASCCGGEGSADAKSSRMGYSDAELAAVPEGANLGLGCGNPQAIAAMRPGSASFWTGYRPIFRMTRMVWRGSTGRHSTNTRTRARDSIGTGTR